MGKLKSQFSSRKFKGGAYASIISVIVIAVVLLVNLVVGELGITKDMTSDGMYSILDSTRDYLEELSDNITIYYLAQDGSDFSYYNLENFFADFNSANKNIQIVQKDPIKYPKFAAEYTDEDISQYSFIVVNNDNGRSKYIDVYDYIITEFDYTTYSYGITGIDLESQLVSAISYVTSEDLPVMYCLTGHGEEEVSSTLADGIAKENVVTAELSLIKEAEVPEDCDILFIYCPDYDLDEQELDIIEDYMAAGGSVIMILDIDSSDLTNLTTLLAYYGVELTGGYIIEGNSQYYMMRTPYQIVPDIESHSITTDLVGTKYAICPIAVGMTVNEDLRDTLDYSPLLVTSDDAYSKADINASSYEFEDGDIEGPFYVGLEVSETYEDEDGNTTEGRMVIYSCGYFLYDQLISTSTYANADMFYNTLNYLADIEASVSIRSISLSTETITVSASIGNLFGLLYVFVIPLIIIAGGIIVVVRRKRL